MSLQSLSTALTLADLLPIGTVADLGSTILEGEVKAYFRPTLASPSDPVHAGYFGASRGKFRMIYPFTEQATVIVGEVTMTDEITGKISHYKAGESWLVLKGTPVLWDIQSDTFIKHYLGAI